MSMSMSMSPSMGPMSMAPASVSTAAYSITALPAVTAAPICVWNCLIPIGLADPSGCDDVTNECACLSAPADVLDFLTGCVQTVCSTSTGSYAASATSLYQSYCQSVFGSAMFSQALAAESSAAATSAGTSAGTPASPSSTSTGDSPPHHVPLFTLLFLLIGGALIGVVTLA